MKLVRMLDRGLIALERGLLVGLFSAMIVISFLQIVLRNFFSSGIIWADPVVRHGVLWVGLLGASLAVDAAKHIRIDIAPRILRGRAAELVEAGADLFAAIVSALLARASFTFISNEMEFGDVFVTIEGWQVPMWGAQLILPVGFTLLTLRFLIKAVERAMGIQPPAETGKSIETPIELPGGGPTKGGA
jgi:TRAP-type C4-dicarboxylate transport system permease small subunit